MKKSPTAAFTLIEVLMVIFLLFYLVYATFVSVRELMEAKGRIDYRTDQGQVQRSLWSIIDRDLRNAFYITAMDLGWNPQPQTQAEKDEGTPLPVKPIPATIFQGTLNQIIISTRSHQRMSQDVPENEQHFVRYVLEAGKLKRAESARAINRDDIGNETNFKEITLLEGVTTLEFKYYDQERERWEDSWDANRAETLDKIPGAVKFKVVFTPVLEDDPDAKPVPVTIESSIRITQRIYKEGSFEQPKAKSASNPPGT